MIRAPMNSCKIAPRLMLLATLLSSPVMVIFGSKIGVLIRAKISTFQIDQLRPSFIGT
jgi:hypothetical protein